MGTKKVSMFTKAWYGDEEMTMEFPDTWEVIFNKMPGHDLPPLTDDQVWQALNNPIGAPRLSELAKGKQRVAILFDDLARPTPAWRVVPFVLKVLADAGLQDDQIRFVAAPGNHIPMHRGDFAKKLGQDIPGRFRIYNHNPYEHFTELGKTSRGTPVQVNREVASCDLKIGIGSLIPHPSAGFGGGAKLVLPGICSAETVKSNHVGIGGPFNRRNPTVGQGKVEGNEVRLDMEEVARILGLDWKIDFVINGRREPVGLFCGDFVAAHRAGVETAWRVYATPSVKGCDIVVANTYPIDMQVTKGLWPAVECMRDGGSAVVVCHSVQGESLHFMSTRFGTDYGGAFWSPDRARRLPNARRIYCFSEYPSRIMKDALGGPDQVVACTTWNEVLIDLMAAHGTQAKVVVYPCASAQLPPPKEPVAAKAGVAAERRG